MNYGFIEAADQPCIQNATAGAEMTKKWSKEGLAPVHAVAGRRLTCLNAATARPGYQSRMSAAHGTARRVRLAHVVRDLLDPKSPSPRAVRARWAHHGVVTLGLVAALAFAEGEPTAGVSPLRLAILLAFVAAFGAEAAVRWVLAHRAADPAIGPTVADLLAVAVPLGALFAGLEAEDAWLAAAVWPLKFLRHATGLTILARVLRTQAGPLAAGLVLFLAVVFAAGAAAHLLERGAQPAFATLGRSVWWAVVTMTTVGYGDLIPQSPGGRLLATATMVAGLGVFALWTSILSTGFAAESRRRDFLDTWDRVSHIPFFHRLDAVTVAEIAHILRPMDCARGTVLIRRGDPGDCMYFIVGGAVEVDVAPRPVRLGPGEFFGEIALLADGRRTADVRAVETSSFLVLDIADFRELAARRPALAEVVRSEAIRRSDLLGSTLPNPGRPTS